MIKITYKKVTSLILLNLFVLLSSCGGSSSAPAIDSTAPQVSITSHASSTIQGLPGVITLQGIATDDVAVQTVTISVNLGVENAVTLLSDDTFSEGLLLTEDINDITVTVTDASSNVASISITISYVDHIDPQVSITSHASSTIQGLPGIITLQGIATDDVAVQSATISVNSGAEQALTLSNSGSFLESLLLVTDENEVTVTVTDTSSNTASASITLSYIAEGNLQTNFGADVNPVDSVLDGFVTQDVGSHNGGFGLAMASDGSLFSTGFGRTNGGSGDYDMVLWKVTSSGSFDSTFGTNGFVFLDDPKSSSGNAGSTNDYARELAIDNDGNVLMVGHANQDMVVARYHPATGALDASFGGDVNPIDGAPDGFVVLDVSGASSVDDASAVTTDSDNNVYIVGTSDDVLYVWKYTSAGVLDASFGANNGFVTHDSGSADKGLDVTFDTMGRLIVLGRSNGAAFLWRMDASGNTDNTFGVNGKATVSPTYTVSKMAIDSTHNIVVVGSTTPGVGDSDMTLWKFTNEGALDVNFGNGNGFITFVGINPAEKDYGYDAGFDAVGNIVVVGSMYTDVVNKQNMAVWRYSSTGVLDTSFATSGYFLNTGAANAGGVSNLDRGFGLVIDAMGSLIISGDSQSASTGADIVVWKLK